VFEILLTTTDAGITGFQNGPETIHGLDHGLSQETCGDVQPAEHRLADRAVVVLAKAPTAKPPTAPTVAPTTNFVVPWPKSSFLPALPSFDGASLAQRPCCKVILGGA
jgi:hypothetical protein